METRVEEDIKLIREIMENSARYTSFSGLSGVFSGTLALIGCYVTWWATYNVGLAQQNVWYVSIWALVLVVAIAQDLFLAHRNARRNGTTVRGPAAFQVAKAIFPGVFLAFVISMVCLSRNELDAIPGVLALGYGAALCSASLFTTREFWWYGLLQLATGAVGLVWLSQMPYSFYVLALSFGVYQILFGVYISCKQRK